MVQKHSVELTYLIGMIALIQPVPFVLPYDITPRRYKTIKTLIRPQCKPWCLVIHINEIIKRYNQTPSRCPACVADTPPLPVCQMNKSQTGPVTRTCTWPRAPTGDGGNRLHCNFCRSVHNVAENTAAMEAVKRLPTQMKSLYSCMTEFMTK